MLFDDVNKTMLTIKTTSPLQFVTKIIYFIKIEINFKEIF